MRPPVETQGPFPRPPGLRGRREGSLRHFTAVCRQERTLGRRGTHASGILRFAALIEIPSRQPVGEVESNSSIQEIQDHHRPDDAGTKDTGEMKVALIYRQIDKPSRCW